MLGHRSIYHNGWRAVCPWPGTSFAESGRQFGTPIPAETLTELDATGWELYDIAEDFAENHDVADENRPRLIEMIAQWYVEAGKYNVLPVDGLGQQRLAEERPQIAVARTRYAYYPGTRRCLRARRPASSTGRTRGRPGRDSGGGCRGRARVAGWCRWRLHFFVQGGKLRYTYNHVADQRFQIVSDGDVPAGRHVLSFEFAPTGEAEPLKGMGTPGTLTLYLDDEQFGGGDLPVTVPIALGLASGVSVGLDAGAPVTDEYAPPFAFTGTIEKVVYDVSGEIIVDHEAEIRMALARQ
jgi:arylsulfatase